MQQNLLYVNRKILPEAQAFVEAAGQGFMFGFGAFETVRIYGGHAFLLDQHLDRLYNAVRFLNLTVTSPAANLKNEIYDYIQKVGKDDFVLKITFSKGLNGTDVVLSSRSIPYKENDYSTGFSIKISSVKRRSDSPLVYYKTLNYLENIIERQQALNQGYNEAVFLNEKSMLTEGSCSNIFFVKGGIVHTPKVECGLLNGIIRQFVILNLIRRVGVGAVEGNYELKDLLNADEVFLTNSVMEVMPVSKIYDKSFDTSSGNTVTKQLMAAFQETLLEISNFN